MAAIVVFSSPATAWAARSSHVPQARTHSCNTMGRFRAAGTAGLAIHHPGRSGAAARRARRSYGGASARRSPPRSPLRRRRATAPRTPNTPTASGGCAKSIGGCAFCARGCEGMTVVDSGAERSPPRLFRRAGHARGPTAANAPCIASSARTSSTWRREYISMDSPLGQGAAGQAAGRSNSSWRWRAGTHSYTVVAIDYRLTRRKPCSRLS